MSGLTKQIDYNNPKDIFMSSGCVVSVYPIVHSHEIWVEVQPFNKHGKKNAHQTLETITSIYNRRFKATFNLSEVLVFIALVCTLVFLVTNSWALTISSALCILAFYSYFYYMDFNTFKFYNNSLMTYKYSTHNSTFKPRPEGG